MAVLKQTPREFLSDFIELYRSYPCLWLIKSKEYFDRSKKDLAYAELVNKYKQFDPSADRNTVVKKINALRTVYKKELAKVNASLKTRGDVYKPSLWYFDLLHFLDNQETARPAWSTMDDAAEEMPQFEDSDSTDVEQINEREITSLVLSTPEGNEPTTERSLTPQTVIPPPSGLRPKRKKTVTPTEEVIQLAGQQLIAMRPDDEFQAFGMYIAHKLRSLKCNQAIFARKLINDVIFEGELEALTKDFRVINCQMPNIHTHTV